MTDTYSPDSWLVSLVSSFQDYINDGLNNYILNDLGAPAGLEIFETVMEFPASEAIPQGVELGKTVIHFDIDDLDNKALGFGPNYVNYEVTDGTLTEPGTLVQQEASVHLVNWDVGIWASDQSGGITNRLLAYQALDALLRGEIARKKCMEQTEGVELVHFQNGRFVTENLNDVRLFRMVGAELVTRVYSRKLSDPEILVDGDVVQDPDLTISSIPLT